ncbi:expressed unknown protein [Ectocarpus siliculosus]|uniref:Uncharacterized protein n=1 Tax=Ectocarpus siliculosus TaxID=2880 RepID=D7FZ25_ECTSI|nr:expressed unknown protein [Ectocarpus siliculosus]|eukprot:CBJ32642.1 expressed unknown protein [Ectocarpus siliculosus]
MSSWYTPERYADWPGSSPPERNTAMREALLWQHVFLGGLGMKTHVHVAVVQAGLRGCDTTFMMDVVFGTAKKGKPLPILMRWDFCPTLITPGLVAKPSLAVWHETAPCFLTGVVTTVTKIAIHGRIPLEWAWPNPRTLTLPTARRPRTHLQWAIKSPGVRPVKRRMMLFNAWCT